MASYRIEWKASAVKELRELDRPIVARVLHAVAGLADEPRPSGSRKLRGSQHTYRIRVGDYRVVYEIADERLLVQLVRVRHRKDVYR